MTDPWGGHQAAVAVAIDNIGEIQDRLAAIKDLCDRAYGAIAEAVGQSQVESAANARDFIAGIQERCNESYGMANQAAAELRRYAGGF